MANTFPITEARQELGFTPSTGVRANIDTRTGEGAVGAAVGQALIAGGRELQERSVRRAAIEIKNRKNLDDISAFKATKVREQALLDIEVMKTDTPPEQWEQETRRIMEVTISSMQDLDFSPEESTKQKLINASNLIGEQKKSFISGSRKLKVQALAAQTDQLVETFRTNGESIETAKQATEFIKSSKNNGVSSSEIILNMKAAKEAGLKLRGEDAADLVYVAIEASQFDAAKELVISDSIPEPKQATLRTAIETAESKQKAEQERVKQDLINETTSTTIRESYQGTLTVAELDKRHEQGLIKDSAFESMRKGLASKIPDVSDPMVRSEISNAITQFKANQITREDAQNVFLDSYESLDEPDRKLFDNQIEATTTLLVETAMSEAKDAGKELISPKFQKFDPYGLRVFDNPEDERRFNLEWRLRNQYNDSLDEWKEAQKDKVISPSDVRRIENDLLIDYRKIRSRGLDAIQEALDVKLSIPTPLKKVKTLRSLSIERLKARREELRKQLK